MLTPIPVHEVMVDDVVTVGQGETASAAAVRLEEHDVGSLVVENGEPVGIVTEKDVVGVLAAGEDPSAVTVSDFMSEPLVTVEPEAGLEEASSLLRKNDIQHLPVVDDGELVGIVTSTDLSYYLPQLSTGGGTVEGEMGIPEENGWTAEFVDLAGETIGTGDRVRFSKTISEEDVLQFASISGDTNPLHLDPEYAEGTRFEGRSAHGVLVTGLVSAALARLPGLTVYLSQELSFQAPVEIGSRLVAVCEVVDDLGKGMYRLSTRVFDDDGMVIDGLATVMAEDDG